MEFTTAIKRREPIEFTLDGEQFEFTPPKTSVLVMATLEDGVSDVEALFNWLGEGLPDAQEKRLEDRLKDRNDDFDIEDLTAIVRGLVSKTAGRPTKRSRG